GLPGSRRRAGAGHSRRASPARGARARRPLSRVSARRSGGAGQRRLPAPRRPDAGGPAGRRGPGTDSGAVRRNPGGRGTGRGAGRESGVSVATAAVVVTWEGGTTTDRCVESLLAQYPAPESVLVVDNASSGSERERLRAGVGARAGVRLLLLDDNRQFAGGLNAGARAAIAAGANRILLLNNDAVLARDALGRLTHALDSTPGAGIAGPCVRDLRRPDRVLSAGERHSVPLLCVPRTLLRYRRRGDRPYAVRGIMGCALLVTRACFESVGGFSEEIAVYYEDVDFCLTARARGFGVLVEPRAVVYHDGLRGFAGGLTPWAAYLK